MGLSNHGTTLGNERRPGLGHDGGWESRRQVLVCDRVIVVMKDVSDCFGGFVAATETTDAGERFGGGLRLHGHGVGHTLLVCQQAGSRLCTIRAVGRVESNGTW